MYLNTFFQKKGRKTIFGAGQVIIFQDENPFPMHFLTRFFSLCFLLSPFISLGQQQVEHSWVKSYSGSNTDVVADFEASLDGNYLMMINSESSDGLFRDNPGQRSPALLEVDQHGKVLWSKIYGGEDRDAGGKIVKLCDGYLISGGTRSDLGDTLQHKGGSDSWLFKVDKKGHVQWQRLLGGTGLDFGGLFYQVEENNYTGLIRTLSQDLDFPAEGPEMIRTWQVTFDSQGRLLKKKHLKGLDGYFVSDMLVHPDGFLYGCGSNYVTFLETDLFLFRMDPEGEIIWQKSVGGSSYDAGREVELLPDGNLLVLGRTESDDLLPDASNWVDILAMVVDRNGEIIQQRRIGGQFHDYFSDLYQSPDGAFLLGLQTSDYEEFDISEPSMLILELSPKLELSSPKVLKIDSTRNRLSHFVALYDDHWMLSIGNTYDHTNEEDVFLVRTEVSEPFEDNEGSSHFQVYPNPASHCLHIQSDASAYPADLRIFDTAGKYIGKYRINGPEQSIDISRLHPGMYFLNWGSEKNAIPFLKSQ
jgi:hypothetical protein